MSATPTAALVEEAETVADGMSARIRDLVWIVENYDPEEEREDDRCPECKTPLGAPEEPGMEPTPFCNCCAHAVVEELALAVQQLRQAVRRAEAERDAQHEQVLRLTAEWDEARVQLRAANDFLRVVTLERDHAQQVEVPDAFWQLDEARAQVWGLICVATNCAIKADKGFPALRQVLDQRDELTATRDLLTAENARLQKERDEDRAELEHSRGNVWALMCLFTNEDNMGRHLKAVIKDLRAQVATLELLRRGGK